MFPWMVRCTFLHPVPQITHSCVQVCFLVTFSYFTWLFPLSRFALYHHCNCIYTSYPNLHRLAPQNLEHVLSIYDNNPQLVKRVSWLARVPMPSRDVDMSVIPIEPSSSSRPTVPLYPPLGSPDDLDAFVKSGRAISFALSPRGNSFTVYETAVRLSVFDC